MILTFGNCKAQLAPYVDTGKCATDPSVLMAVNDAMMRLLLVDDWKLAVQKMTFRVTHNYIVLPDYVDSIVAMKTGDGIPSRVWNRMYEFSESGPGNTTWNGNPGTDLVDLGTFPTFTEIDINASLTLAAFSSYPSDVGKSLHIRGITAGRESVSAIGDLGISLPINKWMNGTEGTVDYDNLIASENTFKEISHVVKPVTAGHITLLAFDKTTKQMQILAVYQPWETTPGFRRYKIINHDHNNGSTIVAVCRMRYVPMRHDNDPLIIQNLPAVISMLQAVREEKARNVMVQQAFENKAIQWLSRQAIQLDAATPIMTVQVQDWGSGDAMNFN